jgi:hypothetical protein
VSHPATVDTLAGSVATSWVTIGVGLAHPTNRRGRSVPSPDSGGVGGGGGGGNGDGCADTLSGGASLDSGVSGSTPGRGGNTAPGSKHLNGGGGGSGTSNLDVSSLRVAGAQVEDSSWWTERYVSLVVWNRWRLKYTKMGKTYKSKISRIACCCLCGDVRALSKRNFNTTARSSERTSSQLRRDLY